MFIDYIGHLENLSDKCEDFKKRITYIYFASGKRQKSNQDYYCETVVYQDYFAPIKQCVELVTLLKPRGFTQDNMHTLTSTIGDLEDSGKVDTLKFWILNYDIIKSFSLMVEKEMRSNFSSFDSQERARINEAMHTCLEGCNYSCVAMSVSAVESRLYKLMTLAKPDSAGNLNKMTLGQLIKEYSENEGLYHNIVPDKHHALLTLCNTYRIFSVHPKKEEVSGSIATSILNLSITFLSDPDSTPESVKTKLATE